MGDGRAFSQRRMEQPRCWPITRAQIRQFGTDPYRARFTGLRRQIGGYRPMPTASDRHAARLAFQRMRVLIADSARLTRQLTYRLPVAI